MNNKQIEIRCEKGSDQARVEQDSKRVLRLGLDLHYRQVTVALQEDGGADQGGRQNEPSGLR